jgi:hypothetical protein
MRDHSSMRSVKITALAMLLVGMVSGVAAAEADAPRELLKPPTFQIASPITDRFAVRGVYYLPSISTTVRYDNSAGVRGTVLSGEDTLGFQDRLDQGSIDMAFRMLERHRIRAEFYKMTRSGDQVVDQIIRYGNDVFLVNDRLVTAMDLRKVDLSYTYSFLRREKFELSAGLAIHLLQAEGELNVPVRFQRERLDVAGPFATLAFDGTWRMTRRFSFNARGNYLSGHTSSVRGLYRQLHGDLQFRFRPNLSFGAGYTATRIKLDSSDASLAGLFDFDFQGPEAFVRVSF